MVHLLPPLRRLLNKLSSGSNRSRAFFCSRCSQYRNELILANANSTRRNGVVERWKNAVALDCEMVSCRPTERWFLNASPRKRKRTPVEVTVAGHCALVDYDYRVVYNSHIRPGPTTAAITNWRGIRPRDIVGAPSLEEAREQILRLLEKKLVVAHDIKNDLASLQIHLDAHIPSDNVRDTSNCEILRRLARVPVSLPRASLRHLALRVLGRRVQTTRPHCPVEDATVTMELYRAVEEEWERQNIQK